VAEVDIIKDKHNLIQRDYMARVNDQEIPKHIAATLAKKWDFDYWDGDRRICYGGYSYIPGYWTPVAERLIKQYKLNSESSVLDVGCGKGYLLFEISKLLPGIRIAGLDISTYAVEKSHPLVKEWIKVGSAEALPWGYEEFDLAFSLNTFHNLYTFQLFPALKEIKRVSKSTYVCVESYRNEKEKENLLYWQVTCEAFLTPEEWIWWFNLTGYDRDHGFIYFE